MTTTGDTTGTEREQTDESLRAEREKADDALGDEASAIDVAADAVISQARLRADAVLARARTHTDRKNASGAPGAVSAGIIRTERLKEDQLLQQERASADEMLRGERAEQVAVLAKEREETDRDLLRERARADEALAARDAFLGIVSHDLRNMLGGMVGFAGGIGRALSRENHVEQVTRYAQRIERSARRMDRLIGDLVDVASIAAGVLAVTPEDADPAQVATEALETFQEQASASGVTLAAEITTPSLVASFDPARILQVLTNLLSNAIKFTPKGGKVSLRLERHGEETRFTVIDTGMGIPADRLEAVFEKFLQVTENDRRGVGLGLYISKCIVQGHGGKIWAESKSGQGSAFCFTLPAHPPV